MAGPGMLSVSRTEKYCTKLADDIMKLRGEKSLRDFKIIVKDGEFQCAKFVLAAHSPMLLAMLNSEMEEATKKHILLNQFSKDIIQIILDYMYCEDISFHKDYLMDLITAADYLQMTELKHMCLEEVPNILEPANVISWWKEAKQMDYFSIGEKCEEMMVADFNKITQQVEFLNLDLTEMKQYVLEICSDKVNSDDTVDVLMKWVGHDDDRIAYLEELLDKVKLSRCFGNRIKEIFKSHETLLDKVPMMYKLLLEPSDAIPETSTKLTNSIVVVGGQEGDEPNEFYWKVNQSDEIVQLGDIPGDDFQINHSICMVPQGFVVTGGVASNMCMIFNASTQLWLRMQDMLTIRQKHGSVCVKKVLYVLGGVVGSNGELSKSVDTMALERGKWVTESNLDLPDYVTFPKVSNLGDRVYLLDEDSCQLWCLDIDQEDWTNLAQFPGEGECLGVSMISACNRLYVAGGESEFHWYNPVTDAWCKGQHQPLKTHKYAALTYHNTNLVLLGGNGFAGEGTDDVEEYDIEKNKWKVLSYKMPRKLNLHHAAVLRI